MKIEKMPEGFVVDTSLSEDSGEWIVRVSLNNKFIKYSVPVGGLAFKEMAKKLEVAKKLLLEDSKCLK